MVGKEGGTEIKRATAERGKIVKVMKNEGVCEHVSRSRGERTRLREYN